MRSAGGSPPNHSKAYMAAADAQRHAQGAPAGQPGLHQGGTGSDVEQVGDQEGNQPGDEVAREHQEHVTRQTRQQRCQDQPAVIKAG
jgi:uncharacterized protein YcfJ